MGRNPARFPLDELIDKDKRFHAKITSQKRMLIIIYRPILGLNQSKDMQTLVNTFMGNTCRNIHCMHNIYDMI